MAMDERRSFGGRINYRRIEMRFKKLQAKDLQIKRQVQQIRLSLSKNKLCAENYETPFDASQLDCNFRKMTICPP